MMVAEERVDTATGVARRTSFQPAGTAHHPAEITEPAGLSSLLLGLHAARAALDETVAAVSSDVPLLPQRVQAVERQLDVVVQMLDRSRRDLSRLAEEMAPARLPDGTCGVPWAVCPHCPGVNLASSAGSSWCPSCGRLGPPGVGRRTYLCIERATVTVRDATGAEAAMCLSHAAGALRRVEHLSVVSATADDVRRLVTALDRPVRIDLAGRLTPAYRDRSTEPI